jgi:outer membrane protein OmpA-like peptidoglycan-associated protein/predicted SprT family Zn-dependent metalloprotease
LCLSNADPTRQSLTLQAKLAVGSARDAAEQEADRVAAAVVSTQLSPYSSGWQPASPAAGPTALVQRQRGAGAAPVVNVQQVTGTPGTVFEATVNGITVRFYLAKGELDQAKAVGNNLATLTAQIKKLNALVTDQAFAVTQLFIYTGATTGFRLILGTPTIYIDSKYAVAGDIGSVTHEMGHAITHSYLQTSTANADPKQSERLRAMLQGVADVYLALRATKQEKLSKLGADLAGQDDKEVPLGHFMVSPSSWSAKTKQEPEHPWDNYDEFFASAFEGFALNRKGLESSIAKFSKKDSAIAAPAKRLLSLLEQFQAGSSGKTVPAPKDVAKAEQEIDRAGAVPRVEPTPKGGYHYPEVHSSRPGGSTPEAPVKPPLLYLVDPHTLEEEGPVRRSGAGHEGPAVAPSIVHEVLGTPGQPLEAGTADFMASRLGHDFGGVRVHADTQAAASALAVGANAYTVGLHVVFGPDRYRPGTPTGDELIAHELTHVLQQQNQTPRVQRDPDDHPDSREDPGRFHAVHEALFVKAPSGGTPAPWVDATAADPGSAGVIIGQFKARFRQHVKDHPLAVGGTVQTKTTQDQAEEGAIRADEKIRSRFPQISQPVNKSALRSAVSILSEAQTSSEDFLLQWLDNRLNIWTDVNDYAIDASDARYQRMLKDLLNDAEIGADLKVLASRQAAFTEGEGGARRVSLHRGAAEDLRRGILTHELIHFYSHAAFREWAEATTAPRVYGEGFTEFLTRRVLQDASRKQYEEHLQKVNELVAKFASEDDIARAYFLGEVWRLEMESGVASKQFEELTGLRPRPSRREEATRSSTGPGIVEVVVPGRHYRFMNLGHDQATPKPEHETALRTIWEQSARDEPSARLRFIGHSSSPGSLRHNQELSLRRSAAFYALARTIGVPEDRLLEADAPPHHGETAPTATESNAQGRAYNRRVELFVVRP